MAAKKQTKTVNATDLTVEIPAKFVVQRTQAKKDAQGNIIRDAEGKVERDPQFFPDGTPAMEVRGIHISDNQTVQFNVDSVKEISWTGPEATPTRYECTVNSDRKATVSTGEEQADGTSKWKTEDKKIDVADAIKGIEENRAAYKNKQDETNQRHTDKRAADKSASEAGRQAYLDSLMAPIEENQKQADEKAKEDDSDQF